MSKLDINRVKFVSLYEVAQISNGKDHKSLPDGKIPVYGSGGIMRNANQYIYDKESVLIPRKGSIGNIFYVDTPFWTVDTIFYTKIDIDKLIPKFLYYYLKTQHLEDLNIAGGVPSLTKTVLDKIQIPLPPLPIQQEIVKILDNFTEHTTILTAMITTEFTARKKQYKYYLNKLMTFDSDVPMLELCMIGTILRGNGLQKSDFTENGVGCIHYGQIYTYYDTFTYETKSFVSPGLASKLKKIHKGDIIITVTSENVEDVCKCVAWLGEDEIVTGGHTAILKHNQNPKYIAYYLKTEAFFVQKCKIVHGTKVIEVTPKDLQRIQIPVPSLQEQARIVAILDKFDAVINDMSTALTSELSARRKQYEYYRDKLLTFKEVSQ